MVTGSLLGMQLLIYSYYQCTGSFKPSRHRLCQELYISATLGVEIGESAVNGVLAIAMSKIWALHYMYVIFH